MLTMIAAGIAGAREVIGAMTTVIPTRIAAAAAVAANGMDATTISAAIVSTAIPVADRKTITGTITGRDRGNGIAIDAISIGAQSVIVSAAAIATETAAIAEVCGGAAMHDVSDGSILTIWPYLRMSALVPLASIKRTCGIGRFAPGRYILISPASFIRSPAPLLNHLIGAAISDGDTLNPSTA